jgi:serine O-acetyltransferase
MLTFKTTIQNIKFDFCRRVQLEGQEHFLSKLVLLIKPGMVGVLCYRFSHYFAQTKLRFLCRFFLLIEHVYCRNEISPYAKIGPGLVLGDIGAIGMIMQVEIGRNCTFIGFNTLTMNQVSGVDFTVDKIIVGDHCVFGSRAKIMRPVDVADGTQVKDNSVVMFSVKKKGTTISGVPAKQRRIDNYEDMISKWNPLLGGALIEAEL